MRVFVTGGTGFVGSAVIQRLHQEGHTIVAAHRGSRPAEWPELVVSESISDLFDISSEMVAGCDAIVHLAGIAHRGSVPDDEFDRVNHQATARLGELAVAASVGMFVFMSTAKVYGERTTGTPFTASSPLNPPDAYSRSKVRADEALRQLSRQTKLSVLVIRPPVVIGDGAKGNISMLRTLLDRGIPIPVPRGGNRRSFVRLSTIVSAVVEELSGESKPTYRVRLVVDSSPDSTQTLIEHLARPGRARTVAMPAMLLRSLDRAIGLVSSARLGPLYQDFELNCEN